MRATKKKLTKSVVDALEPPTDKPYYRVFDGEINGFCVRVARSGDKLWQVEYRPSPGGRGVAIKRITLGAVTVLTPDEARKQAQATLADVARGADPASDKIAKRRELKTAGLIDLYEKEGCYVLRGLRMGQPMKARNKAYTMASLRHHVVPLIGTKRVSDIDTADIEQLVRDITAGKTSKDEKAGPRRRIIVKGGEGAARKAARNLSAVFSFAVRRKIMATNPCETAAINKVDGKRTRFLVLDEVRRLGKALDELEAIGVNPKALDIARLWALTGARRDEIAGLKWTEVDSERACLVLEDSKTGRNIRPLAAPALALLSVLPRYGKSPWVFPASRGGGHFQGTKRIWPKIVKQASLPGVTPHTLRHTLGSAAVSFGETLAMTGAILGHVAGSRATAIYAHIQHDPMARAADRAVGPIAAALAGQPSAAVTPLRMKKAGRR